MNKEIELAYFAGVLDGDGSFSLIKSFAKKSRSPLYYPMIQLASANSDLINLFKSKFGGYTTLRNAYIGKDGSVRLVSHQWKSEKSARCLPLLEVVIPYLRIKKERAQYLKDYIVNNPFMRGSNKLSDQLLAQREKAYLKMRKFNDKPSVNGELFSNSKRFESTDPLFWSYVAGIIDTDGSISLKKEIRNLPGRKTPVYTPTILLTMVDCRAIYYIMNNFNGGNLCVVKAKTTNTGFCYRFSITSKKNVIKFLENCIDYLYLKKHIAKELLEFCRTVKVCAGGAGVPESELLYRETIYSRIKNFNNGVYKFPLMDLKLLPGDAEDNKAQAAKAGSVNVASEETSKDDAVL